jgi:capsular exopolysaccharide synthesis family protein
LLNNPTIKAPVKEAYKTLRTNIQFSSLDQERKVLLVTSASEAEGKSTTASNLAIAMAQAGKRVLLIDCDLRKPVVHRTFHLPNMKGLTNILAEDLDHTEICNSVGIQGLDVLTSGPKPPNPSELMGTLRMETFIKAVSQEYDQIIMDAPPVLPVTDAAVLSRLTDGVILVLAYGQTSREAAAQAKESLGNVNARIIGAVINSFPANGRGGYYGYYYYSEEDTGKKEKRHSGKRTNGRQVDV